MAASAMESAELVRGAQGRGFALPWPVALGIAALILALMTAGAWLAWLSRETAGLPEPYGYRWASPVPILAAGTVGLVLALRVPRNRLGVLLLAGSFFGALDFFLEGYASYAVIT